ncbi:unnamed protein product [Cunninghamella echinulata]
MDQTSFGQVQIYNELFNNPSIQPPRHSPTECIGGKLSYYATHNNKRIPVMIGSNLHVHPHDNPLNMNGYFIIDGICKSVSSMYVYDRVIFTKDRAYLSDGSRISIISMGHYENYNKGKKSQWYLPLNYTDIINYSINPEKMRTHLEIVAKHTDANDFQPTLPSHDILVLCYMFEEYLGIRDVYIPTKRLITAGELIKDSIDLNLDIMKFFRTHTWTVKNIQNIHSVSEDMKHYSIIGDIEAIRRVTYPTVREITRMKDRYIQDYDKYKFCPVQTSDGALCGTIMYLAKDATVTMKGKYTIIPGNDYLLFVDGQYISTCKNIHHEQCNVIYHHHAIFVWTKYGRILHGTSSVSVTVDYIPYRLHNPAIRSMFTSSMIKQAITNDPKIRNGWFHDTKYLIQGEQPLIGKHFPVDSGWNLITAVMPYYGYNIEDAIVIRKSVAEKYTTTNIYIYHTELKTKFDKIIETFVKIGDRVHKQDILFKAYHPSEITTIETVRTLVDGIIDNIHSHPQCYAIKIIQTKSLEVGDKMSSRHGQKGIISLIVEDEKMPHYYINNTWQPIDLIMNPHTFPTRKTMGQILEMGNKLYPVRIQDQHLKNPIMVGPCFYMALRHQVNDKLQFRNDGPIDPISLQAVPGKSRQGGLRFGHMERDILLAAGAHKELQYIYNIDKIQISCCNQCGIIGHHYQLSLCPHKRYTHTAHQHLILCLAFLRANKHDIRYYPNTNQYEIIDYNIDDTPEIKHAGELHFGMTNFLDIRHYKDVPILPAILRNDYLNNMYKRMFNRNKHDDIFKELKKMLTNKKIGIYHQYVEGHRVNHCVRSVIVPAPYLPTNTIELPIGCDIGKPYGLLNRQPSISEQSIMSVHLIIGKNKTIGINPQLCEAFNADFDGDEMCVYGIDDICDKLPVVPKETQDYKHKKPLDELTHEGFTCNKEGIKYMIDIGAKGTIIDYKHIYEKIGDVIVNGEVIGHIHNSYMKGLTEDEWYIQSKAGREGASSIGINTPFIGDLNATCNRTMI